MSEQKQVVAVIADIVQSRELRDRDAAQRAVPEAFAAADRRASVEPVRAAWPTVGDEFQAVYATWQDAWRATLRLPNELPAEVRVRLGLGLGDHRILDSEPALAAEAGTGPRDGVGEARSSDASAARRIEDGTAWYRAREAVGLAESRGGDPVSAFLAPDPSLTAAVDGLFLLRDHIVGRLKAREHRLLTAVLDGATQAEAARAERITQSAVSQAMARSGAGRLVELDASLTEARGGAA